VVLDHPKDVVNIAGVVRVMKNFGLNSLSLVDPDDFDPHRIEGIAHRSRDLVERVELHESLSGALARHTLVIGTTARPRTASRNYVRPRRAAARIAEFLSHQAVARPPHTIGSHEPAHERDPGPIDGAGRAALVFGREDRGLTNSDLDLCHEVVVIPTSRYHPSLNLAQACLVMAYEIFLAFDADAPSLPQGRRARRPPTHAELEQVFQALERGLARIEFYKARKPSAVMRTLRTLLTRARPDLREARLIAAIGHEIGHYFERQAKISGIGEESYPGCSMRNPAGRSEKDIQREGR